MNRDHRLKFFLFAGEPSGDLHGGPLLGSLKRVYPDALFTGVGGPSMRAEGLECIERMESFQVMGFSDVLWALPALAKQFYRLRDHILRENPDAVIFIDYPGFNLRLEKALRKNGYKGKLVHYICPSVWAWGKGRIPVMAKNLDLLLTIYPFESECFSNTALKIKYVGNPLIEKLKNYPYNPDWKKILGIPLERPLISVFPGSRKGEIARNFPIQLEAMEKLKDTFPEVVFAISCAQKELEELISGHTSKSRLVLNKDLFIVPRSFSYELMRDSHTAIAKSGTITLELALHQRPTVVLYQLTSFNRFIAKYILRLNLPNYCIVNILAKKNVFPELIASGVTSDSLYEQTAQLYQNSTSRNACLDGCKNVIRILSSTNVNENAAQAIAELINAPQGVFKS